MKFNNEKSARLSTTMKKKAMLEAMIKSLGVVTASANSVGISRETHYSWLRNDPEYKVAIEECIEIALDFAETSLLKQIQNGNTSATIFYLKTKGKHRGYIETNHILQTDLPPNDLKDKTEEELWEIINRKV